MQSFVEELDATMVRILAYLSGLSALAICAAQFATQPLHLASAEPVSEPVWVDVARPYPAFSIGFADSGEPEPRYAILRHLKGGGRKDVMRWGEPASASRFGAIEIYRPGTEREGFDDATAEVAALTGELSLAGPMVATSPVATKFGPMALVAFSVNAAGAPRGCLGFARAYTEPRLQIAGWYCVGGPEVVDRTVLACALDRLTLISAGSEPKIAELFARAEMHRTFCGRKSPILAATPRHDDLRDDWIEGAMAPKLRGRLAAR